MTSPEITKARYFQLVPAVDLFSEQSADDKVTSGLLNEGPGWGVVNAMLKISASIWESFSSTLVALLWIAAKVS